MTVMQGDSAEVLRELEDASVEAVVTDPPHGLFFMGSEWDAELPEQAIWDECFRVLKPGGHAFVMSSERLGCLAGLYMSLRKAGFEVDETQVLNWLSLTGMPKSSDVSKVADKEAFRAWLDHIGRECVACPDHREPKNPETGEKQRCVECERVFSEGDLTHHDKRKAASAAVNGNYDDGRNVSRPVLEGDRSPAAAGFAAPAEYRKQRYKDGTDLLSRLLSLHWPSSPAERREQWDACVAEVPEGWDCGRPPGVRVKTGTSNTRVPKTATHHGATRFNEGGYRATQPCDEEGNATTSAPSTPDAVRWDGWRGSCAGFKPFCYPVIHAQKPREGSYLANARAHGVGPLNVSLAGIPYTTDTSLVNESNNPSCDASKGDDSSDHRGRAQRECDVHRICRNQSASAEEAAHPRALLSALHSALSADSRGDCPACRRLRDVSLHLIREVDPTPLTLRDGAQECSHLPARSDGLGAEPSHSLSWRCGDHHSSADASLLPSSLSRILTCPEWEPHDLAEFAEWCCDEPHTCAPGGCSHCEDLLGRLRRRLLPARRSEKNLPLDCLLAIVDIDSIPDAASCVNTQTRTPANILSYGDLLGDLQRYADLSAWCEALDLPPEAADLLEAGFVYSPKPSRAEKCAGLDDFEEGPPPACARSNPAPGRENPLGKPRTNTHPTAKPVALCAYLVNLCTREGQTVLDPFCGSGTTGCAAALFGRDFIGIDLSEEYCAIARARIAHAQRTVADDDDTCAEVPSQPALLSAD